MDALDESPFAAAAGIAADLALSPEAAVRWAEKSACAGMTVGGLAHHLVSQVGKTVRRVGASPSADHDWPVTRMMEIVVHPDDLAAF